jgi:ATP-dependent RNA helicase DDX51/DBP6
VRTDLDDPAPAGVQKLLCSATLPRDPTALAALGLRRPAYFLVHSPPSGAGDGDGAGADADADGAGEDAGARDGALGAALTGVALERFSMPETLRVRLRRVVPAPANAVAGALSRRARRAEAARAQLARPRARCAPRARVHAQPESTTRLVTLLELFDAALTARTPGRTDSEPARCWPRSARAPSTCSCARTSSRAGWTCPASRMSSAPTDVRRHVHRARAAAGDAWTLVEEQQARHWQGLLTDAGHASRLRRVRVGEKQLTPLVPAYEVRAFAGVWWLRLTAVLRYRRRSRNSRRCTRAVAGEYQIVAGPGGSCVHSLRIVDHAHARRPDRSWTRCTQVRRRAKVTFRPLSEGLGKRRNRPQKPGVGSA